MTRPMLCDVTCSNNIILVSTIMILVLGIFLYHLKVVSDL